VPLAAGGFVYTSDAFAPLGLISYGKPDGQLYLYNASFVTPDGYHITDGRLVVRNTFQGQAIYDYIFFTGHFACDQTDGGLLLVIETCTDNYTLCESGWFQEAAARPSSDGSVNGTGSFRFGMTSENGVSGVVISNFFSSQVPILMLCGSGWTCGAPISQCSAVRTGNDIPTNNSAPNNFVNSASIDFTVTGSNPSNVQANLNPVVTPATCTHPSTLTYNSAGQVTACVPGPVSTSVALDELGPYTMTFLSYNADCTPPCNPPLGTVAPVPPDAGATQAKVTLDVTLTRLSKSGNLNAVVTLQADLATWNFTKPNSPDDQYQYSYFFMSGGLAIPTFSTYWPKKLVTFTLPMAVGGALIQTQWYFYPSGWVIIDMVSLGSAYPNPLYGHIPMADCGLLSCTVYEMDPILAGVPEVPSNNAGAAFQWLAPNLSARPNMGLLNRPPFIFKTHP